MTRGLSRIVDDHLGSDEVGGEELGGSKRSERPEADPGENGESQSRSMSIGDEPLALMSRLVADLQAEHDPAGIIDSSCSYFCFAGRAADTLGGRLE